MQIRNAVEFFYAADILRRHDLTALMIEIDPLLLRGTKQRRSTMDTIESMGNVFLCRNEYR